MTMVALRSTLNVTDKLWLLVTWVLTLTTAGLCSAPRQLTLLCYYLQLSGASGAAALRSQDRLDPTMPPSRSTAGNPSSARQASICQEVAPR